MSSESIQTSNLIGANSLNSKFNERHRPQVHFSPPAHWMNDPNGMFYFKGEYHLFYQHNPNANVWGPMHWGHAISRDLLVWEHQPIALFPDELGAIFSGSVVVDINNTSGLGTKKNPPLVAFYTYHHAEKEAEGRYDYQTQAIAFSLDEGRTWSKYAANPVIHNPGIKDFRDPKVSWHQDSKKWIMVLAQNDHIGFYSSSNLIDWQFESAFGKEWGNHVGVWECPDLIQLPIDGTQHHRYVLLVSITLGGPNGGSATQYFVGDFDGKQFSLDKHWQSLLSAPEDDATSQPAVWLDYGTDNYAGVTFAKIPAQEQDNIFIGWMSNWQYANQAPTTNWRNAMTIPRILSLYQHNDVLKIRSVPIPEINSLTNDVFRVDEISTNQEVDLADVLKLSEAGIINFTLANVSKCVSLKLANELGENTNIQFDFANKRLSVDRTHSGLTDFNDNFASIQHAPIEHISGSTNVTVILDRSSVEVFLDDGKIVMTSLVFPTKSYQKLLINLENNSVINNVELSNLHSIWNSI